MRKPQKAPAIKRAGKSRCGSAPGEVASQGCKRPWLRGGEGPSAKPEKAPVEGGQQRAREAAVAAGPLLRAAPACAPRPPGRQRAPQRTPAPAAPRSPAGQGTAGAQATARASHALIKDKAGALPGAGPLPLPLLLMAGCTNRLGGKTCAAQAAGCSASGRHSTPKQAALKGSIKGRESGDGSRGELGKRGDSKGPRTHHSAADKLALARDHLLLGAPAQPHAALPAPRHGNGQRRWRRGSGRARPRAASGLQY